MKEKSQQLKDLIHFHQNLKQRIRDYEDILYKIIQFHQVREEVRHTMMSGRLSVLNYEIKNK